MTMDRISQNGILGSFTRCTIDRGLGGGAIDWVRERKPETSFARTVDDGAKMIIQGRLRIPNADGMREHG